jgi:hypothetical protein
LDHRIDTLVAQLQHLGLLQQQSTERQGRLMAGIRLVHWLSMIALGLASVLCGEALFFVFQRKPFGVGFLPERRMHIDGETVEAETGLEGHWKESS